MTLVTQTVSDLPVVLIVTDQLALPLIEWLQQLFSEHQLIPQIINPVELEQTLDQYAQRGIEIYRVVLVSGFGITLAEAAQTYQSNSLPARLSEWKDCLSTLANQSPKKGVTAILGGFSWQAPTTTHPFVQILSELALFGARLAEQIKIQLPETQVFFGWDCLIQSPTSTPTQMADDLEMPLLFSSVSAQARVLFDPQQTWKLQTLASFFIAISQQLLKPLRPAWILVQGKAELSQSWLNQAQTIIDQYFAYRPTLVPIVLPEQTLPQPPDIICQTESLVADCWDAQLRTLPHALAKLDQLSELAAGQGKVLRWEPHIILAGLDQTGASSLIKTTTTSVIPSMPPKQAVLDSNFQSARIIQKKVDKKLIQQSKIHSEPIELKTPHLVGPLNLETELQKLFGKSRGEYRQERLQSKVKITQKIVAKSKRHKTIFYLGSALVVLGLGLGVLWGTFELSLSLAQQQWQQDLQALATHKALSSSRRWSWQTPLSWQVKLYQPILKEDFSADATAVIELDGLIHDYVDQTKELSQQTGTLMTLIMGQQSLELSGQIKQLTQVIGKQQATVDQFADKLKNFNTDGTTASLKQEITQVGDQLKQDEINLPAATQVLAAAPDLLGNTSKQTYAVILQNQQELRPTGGFIQAVGKLTFSQGMLIDHSFQSVYELDDKLTSQVVPPDEIKRFLGETRWYLRDSNWNPDFPSTASQINFFLQESTGRPVDGVIAITFETVRKLLQITGPLDIPELNEQVTDKNLYDRLDFHAETKTVEVNGQKLDYVSLLLDKLVTKIATLEPTKLAELVAVWSQSLQTRDVLLASINSSSASLWQGLGWDGGVIQPHCPSQFITDSCLVDQLYQVDANVGINKVNPYVDKKVVDHIEVTGSTIIHRRTITYRNQAVLDSWPQGQYRAYLKFVLGKAAQPQSLTINGEPVSRDQIVSYSEQNGPVIGTLIQVPRQKAVTVELTYQLNLPYKAPFSYFFFSQKQPGVVETQDVLLSYQRGLKPRLIAPQAEITAQLLNFHLQREDHTFVGVTFE